MTDLFTGDTTPDVQRKGVRVTGYAGSPGKGPAGETCGTCRNIIRTGYSNKVYRKCGHPLAYRSHCAATDIKARMAACEHWQPTPSAG